MILYQISIQKQGDREKFYTLTAPAAKRALGPFHDTVMAGGYATTPEGTVAYLFSTEEVPD